jgi:O-antigen/teichoic acid export membrane protein
LRSNFAWTFGGNLTYALCQWGMIVALAKLGNSFMVGQFSLGLAIVTPVLMFANLDLRAVQATDSTRQFRFAEYLRLRITTTLVAVGIIVSLVSLGTYEKGTALVILAVALAKSIETLSDIHYGLFQLNDRLDRTGMSMILRGVIAVAALCAAMQLTHQVLWACTCIAIGWLGALLLFDMRNGYRMVLSTEAPSPSRRAWGVERLRTLLWLALPLGLGTTIASINLYMPRYFIHARMGEHALGIFSAIGYATVAMTLVGDSLAQCVIPRMSRLYAAARMTEFRTLLTRLVIAAGVIGLIGLILAHSLGRRFLTLVYSREYALNPNVFTLLTAAAAIQFAASMLTSGITSARCFRIQVPLFLIVAACTAVGCALWVPGRGLAGAAAAVLVAATVRFGLAGLVVRHLIWRPAGSGPVRFGFWGPSV